MIDDAADISVTVQRCANMILPSGWVVLNGRDMCEMVVSESFGNKRWGEWAWGQHPDSPAARDGQMGGLVDVLVRPGRGLFR